MASGSVGGGSNDTLFIGSATDLLAYDVHKNKDLFYKDVCMYVCMYACKYVNETREFRSI